MAAPSERRELLWPSPPLLILFLDFASHLPAIAHPVSIFLFWYLIITRNSNPAPPASSHRQLDWIFRDLGFSLRGQDSRERVEGPAEIDGKNVKLLPKVYHHSPSPMYVHEGFVFSLFIFSNPRDRFYCISGDSLKHFGFAKS